MAKYKFGSKPKTFSKNIKWKEVDGNSLELQIVFNTATSDECAEMITVMFDTVNKERGGVEVADMSIKDIVKTNRQGAADFLLKVINSWELEDDLTRDNVLRFMNEQPGGSEAAITAFRDACMQGRMGN